MWPEKYKCAVALTFDLDIETQVEAATPLRIQIRLIQIEEVVGDERIANFLYHGWILEIRPEIHVGR